MKKIITKIALFVLIMGAMAVTANAADFDKNPAAVDVAVKLIENGTVTVAYGEADKASAVEFKQAVQEYVDAITAESQTPQVKCTIRNASKPDSELVMSLVHGEEIDFDTNAAGSTFEAINSYICDALSYDNEAANAANRSITHSSWTANGALSTGKSVCQGYANLFAIFAEQNDYEVIKLRGYIDGAEYHVINVVRIDGQLIAIDCTMNDTNNYRSNITRTLDEYCAKYGFVPSVDVNAAFTAKYAA